VTHQPAQQAQPLDALTLPLHGRQVIEASAGTGKTWTLAALYVRLVLGHRREEALLPPQILVMTFTDAATAELRDRIRLRLSQAAAYFDASAQNRAGPHGFEPDAFLVSLRDSYPRDAWPRCALQLNCAAEWMDDAAIYTIHGWSRRMLSQHTLDSRTLFEQTHLDNAKDLQRTLVQDYWRAWFYPLSADTLQHITPLMGHAPDDLLDTVQSIWRDQERTPRTIEAPTNNPAQLVAQHLAWQTELAAKAAHARRLWSDTVWHALEAAIANKAIHGRGISAPNLARWSNALKEWAEQSAPIKPDWLNRFTTTELTDKGWADATGFAFFAAVEDYVAHLNEAPDTHKHIALHAAHTIGLAYQEAKAQRAAFDFSDLLQNLHHAVMAEDGRLATAIRHQYPVALVDEFQDTDPWQYGTLNRIYDTHACTNANSNALVMIGDPKQAIYSFRGADLGTYLQARDDALAHNPHALHTLSGNRRSSDGLVHAVNHVFTQIDAPFASTIDFVPVSAEGGVAPLTQADGTPHAAMTVWHMPCGEKPTKASTYVHSMSDACANHMAQLLNDGLAEPGDMAVLVRGQPQADAIRAALRERHIPSVYLSDRSNVYASPEALDLWRLLRAVASPRQTQWVRSAVGSGLWTLDLDEVLHLTHHEAEWESLLDSFHQWHQMWQQQGVLPMLHHWMHSQGVAQRLLAHLDGERQLSNLLHLGELLQHAAQSLQGEHALVRFLGEQIHSPTESADAQKMRLETDAQCVQVITYHKSKGLQYPLVFVPFAGSFKTETAAKSSYADDDEDTSDKEAPSSVEEDMRLLYVALTRAQRALWLGMAETYGDLSGDAAKGTLKQSATAQLLKRQTRGDLATQLNTLWGSCPDIAVQTLPESPKVVYQARTESAAIKDALTPQRTHHSQWWTASFSAITRGLVSESKRDEAVADAITDAINDAITEAITDAPAPESTDSIRAWQSFPAGARYGTLLHDLLEWLSHNQWPVANAEAPAWAQHAWGQLLERKASWLQLGDAPRAQLAPWLQAVVQTPLPLSELNAAPLTLRDLRTEHLWPEMEFNLEVHQLSASQLDPLIQRHVFEGTPRPALQPRVMHGMLTGSMDLVLQHDGRYWVVDYKSNKLPNYDSATLQDAVLHKRYDVQYVLYTLALHRLLKVRLPGYDYAQHMGGAVYLFLRGIDAAGAGVHVHRPSQALIETLDAWFASPQGTHAASA
jgi:exodeoxyribonuclease V beta subunit